jgi:hypothetical protein
MQRVLSYIKNNHRDLLFYLFVIWNCFFLFQIHYIPTLDGGSHAYNAKIMGSLLFGGDELYGRYYQMNLEPVPNWFTGGLSMVLNAFLSFSAAEKVILLIYFIGFPLLFRKVADKLSEKKSYLIFLVFPLTHYSLLYYGFFNFSYGILFFLLGISFWIKNAEALTIKKLLLFAGICLLAWFSHLFAFLSLLIFLAVYEAYFFFYQVFLSENKKPVNAQLRESIMRGVKVVACTIAPLLLTWMYFRNRPALEKNYLDTKTLNNLFTGGEIFKSYSTEDYLAAFFFYLFAGLLVYAMISKLRKAFEEKKTSAFFSRNDVFLLVSIVMLFLFYTQADSDGYGAFISQRFSLFVFILAGLWLAGCRLDKAAELMSTLVLVIGLYYFVGLKKDGVRWLNSELAKMDGVTDHIKEGATVAPVHFANYNWLGLHYSNYLAARKHIIITENFEASTGYFPVQWKSAEQSLYLTNFPSVTDEDCAAFAAKLKSYPTGPVDYVLFYGEQPGQPYYEKLLAEVKKNYRMVYSFQNVWLYKRDPELSKLSPEQLKEVKLKELEAKIRGNAEWMKQIEQKAKEQNLSIEEMIRRDAAYVYDQENKK